MSHYAKLLKRYEGNPILTAKQWPYPCNSVFNPGVTQLADGTTLLLCRVEDFRGHSHLCAARSENGYDNWIIDKEPTLLPDPIHYPGELWGIEDPRIVWLEERQQYGVTYTAYTQGGPGVALALTKDFKTFERLGVVFAPDDKDAALFPHRIGDRWAMIHRPYTHSETMGAHIWISFSPDLKHWGDHTILLRARLGAWWDAGRIGLSPPLIQTSKGWLMMYHGVRFTPAGPLYRLGLSLLHRDDVSKCQLRADEWVFGPMESYELIGDVGGAVFPCGYVIEDDNDTIRLYYGGADSCVAIATGRVSQMLDWVLENGHSEEPVGMYF